MRKVSGVLLVVLTMNGCAGAEGPEGAPGRDGADGVSGPAGPTGPRGDEGAGGADGDPGEDGADGAPRSLVFEDVGFPQTDAEKRSILASRTAWVGGVAHPIGYHSVIRTGEVLGGNTFGLIVDAAGDPVVDEDGAPYISAAADFTSFLDAGGELWAVTHLETNPGGMYLTALRQDGVTGELTATATTPIDFATVDGLWTPCAGSITPWNTHLGSEEYPPDVREWDAYTTMGEVSAYWTPMLRYFGLDIFTDVDADGEPDHTTLDDAKAVFDPFAYGFPVEVEVSAGGAVKVAKHYAMGRMALELARVMPDERTVYLTDDGSNVGLYLFVADVAGDLSAGRLYAMKWYQTSGIGAGAADLGWIDLGHATNAEVEAFLHTGLTFADLFDTAEPIVDPVTGEPDGTCPAGFVSTNAGDWGLECLALKPGMELAASRLETRRYAAYLGATTELRKEEGIAFDSATNTLFVAMSAIERGMEDYAKAGAYSAASDLGGPNDVRVTYNPCGAVYALDLAGDAVIGSEYVARNMYALVEGTPMTYAEGSPFEGNACSVNGIASPDNVTFVEGYGTLIIGEDTSHHQNDVMWAYDMATGRMDRIQTTPYGAETTSAWWHGDLRGFGYLTSVVQHPFDETDSDKLIDPAEAEAYVGYVGPFPAMPF